MDQLVGLSDDLARLDAAAEQYVSDIRFISMFLSSYAYCTNYSYRVTRKLTQYFADVLEDEQDKLQENLVVSGSKFEPLYVIDL